MNNKRFLIYMDHEEYNLRKRIVEMAFRENKKEKAVDLVMKLVSSYPVLYRFRKPNNEELDTLKTGQIFLSRASRYEDLGDCEMNFDFQDLAKYFMEEKKPENYQHLPQKIKKDVLKQIPKKMVNNEKYSAFKKKMRGSSLVACFTNNYIEEMWKEYADDGKGFCAVYDIREIIFGIKDSKLLFCPIRYVENRGTCEDIIFTSDEYGDGNISFYKYCNKYCLSCMTKDLLPYSKEGEWRLIQTESDLDQSEDGELKPFINPSYIITGENISVNSEFKSNLEKIAYDLNIKIYTHLEYK